MHEINREANEAYERLFEMGVSEQTLSVASSLKGYSLETMLGVLFALFGYTSFDQLDDDEND